MIVKLIGGNSDVGRTCSGQFAEPIGDTEHLVRMFGVSAVGGFVVLKILFSVF